MHWHTPLHHAMRAHQIPNTDQVLNHHSHAALLLGVTTDILVCLKRVCRLVLKSLAALRRQMHWLTPLHHAMRAHQIPNTDQVLNHHFLLCVCALDVCGTFGFDCGVDSHLDADGHPLELPVVELPARGVVVARIQLRSEQKKKEKQWLVKTHSFRTTVQGDCPRRHPSGSSPLRRAQANSAATLGIKAEFL